MRSPRKKKGRAKPQLFIMARLPVAGRAKTRLGRRVGAALAINIYRALLKSIIVAVGRDRRWETVLAVTPGTCVNDPLWRRLAPHCRVVAQGGNGLGERMAKLLATAGKAPAAVMGSDILDVGQEHVAAAWQALRGHDGVLAMAEDGGFWLCAVRGTLRRFPKRGSGAFANVIWSSPRTGTDTRLALEAHGFRVGLGPMRRDLDR